MQGVGALHFLQLGCVFSVSLFKRATQMKNKLSIWGDLVRRHGILLLLALNCLGLNWRTAFSQIPHPVPYLEY